LASCSDHIVRLVECDSPDFAVLVSTLDAELEDRYPGLSTDGPPPAQDLLVVVVAYSGDAPVGCGALRELEPGVCEIKRMFVLPEARRLGAARRMLEVLEARGRALGYSAVRLGSVSASRKRWRSTSHADTAAYRCSANTKAVRSAFATRKHWSDHDLSNKRIELTRRGASRFAVWRSRAAHAQTR